jgi:hypothetical protein
MRSTPVFDSTRVYLADYYSPMPANHTYTISRPNPNNPPAIDQGDESSTPNVYITLTVGTRMLRVDVLQGAEVVGTLAGWPQMHIARSAVRAWFHGVLDDGKVLQEGRYRFRVMALRIFGDEERKEDWDVVETVEFELRYE